MPRWRRCLFFFSFVFPGTASPSRLSFFSPSFSIVPIRGSMAVTFFFFCVLLGRLSNRDSHRCNSLPFFFLYAASFRCLMALPLSPLFSPTVFHRANWTSQRKPFSSFFFPPPFSIAHLHAGARRTLFFTFVCVVRGRASPSFFFPSESTGRRGFFSANHTTISAIGSFFLVEGALSLFFSPIPTVIDDAKRSSPRGREGGFLSPSAASSPNR